MEKMNAQEESRDLGPCDAAAAAAARLQNHTHTFIHLKHFTLHNEQLSIHMNELIKCMNDDNYCIILLYSVTAQCTVLEDNIHVTIQVKFHSKKLKTNNQIYILSFEKWKKINQRHNMEDGASYQTFDSEHL